MKYVLQGHAMGVMPWHDPTTYCFIHVGTRHGVSLQCVTSFYTPVPGYTFLK